MPEETTDSLKPYTVYLTDKEAQEIEDSGRGESLSRKLEYILSDYRKLQHEKRVFKSIDLFAGIGGIRLGFDRAFGDEIETVYVCEWDEYAKKTYRLNFNDSFDIAGDITAEKEEKIPEFDLCLAGFPCQAFSLAGKRMGFDDDYKGMSRGTLFFDVARICEFRKPKVMDFERMTDDAGKLKGWYKNRILHALLAFFLSSVGSMIGTFVAFPMLIANL